MGYFCQGIDLYVRDPYKRKDLAEFKIFKIITLDVAVSLYASGFQVSKH
jgi:hypothetical protein